MMFYMNFMNLLITFSTELEYDRISKYHHFYEIKSHFHNIIYVGYCNFVNWHKMNLYLNPTIHAL